MMDSGFANVYSVTLFEEAKDQLGRSDLNNGAPDRFGSSSVNGGTIPQGPRLLSSAKKTEAYNSAYVRRMVLGP